MNSHAAADEAASTAPRLPTGTVTFLFSDIEGSTVRWERDRAAMQEAVRRHDALVRSAVETEEGYVFKTIGDAFCAAFARAENAVSAALRAQLALAAEDFSAVGGLRVRMALHSGTAEERHGDYFGPSVNRVARLLAIGHGGQVLLSGVTADLAKSASLPAQATLNDLGTHRLKDLAHPERVYQLVTPDLPDEFPRLRSLEGRPNNLPQQVTAFFGRDEELAQLKTLLGKARLVTLVGAGGVGKTRLSLQAAADLLDDYEDGVWFVELASLVDPNLVPATIASLFGVSESPDRPLTESLVQALRGKRALIVLDNCEHLVAAAATIADALIRGCPNVQLLANSRERLTIAGETVVPLASLAVPSRGDDPAPDAILPYGAVALFVDRARAADIRFELNSDNASAVAEICRRLDGIALAIELAAPRIKALSAEQLCARLQERFRILTGGSRTALPRQQTMRALIDWSYDLLTPNEKALFRRVAVFAGGWTLEAAEAVSATQDAGRSDGAAAGGELIEAWQVLDLLSSLVEKSMVVAELSGSAQRYRLLESNRQYAAEKLTASGEKEALQQRHALYFLGVMRRAKNAYPTTPTPSWMAPLKPEVDNFRMALDWALTERRDVSLGAELVGLLAEVFLEAVSRSEGSRWLKSALSALGDDPPPALAAPLLLSLAGFGAFLGSGRAQRIALLERSVALYRTLDEPASLSRALSVLAFNLMLSNETGAAPPLIDEAIELARKSGDRRAIAFALRSKADSLIGSGLIEQQRRIYSEAIALLRTTGDDQNVAIMLNNLAECEHAAGQTARAIAANDEATAIARKFNLEGLLLNLGNSAAYHLSAGRFASARAAARESLQLARERGIRRTAAHVVEYLAAVSAAFGNARRAARLAGYADARVEEIGEPRELTEQRAHDMLMKMLREALSEEQLTALMDEGAVLDEDAGIEEALRV